MTADISHGLSAAGGNGGVEKLSGETDSTGMPTRPRIRDPGSGQMLQQSILFVMGIACTFGG